MAFIFPEDKNDFRAPNGVVYRWDGFKWVVKSFRSHDDFLVTLDDDPPDEPKEGDLWFDTKADELTLYLYTGTEWVPASPPVSLDGIEAQINDALIIQDDLLGRVAAGEGKQKQIENKVAALEGTVVDGKWYAESRSNPREGGFDITTGGLQSMSDWNADYIRIHKTDSNGKAFTFAEVSTGDYIRIGAPGSTAVYKINEVVSGSLDWQAFGVELANSTAAPIPDLTYDFEFLPSFDPSAYATKEYVDSMDELNVKKAGSTMTGDLQFDSGSKAIQINNGGRLRIKGKDSGGGGRTFIDIQTADHNGAEGFDAGYRVRIYHLGDPAEPYHAANKKYVDEQVVGAVDGLASEEYVDEKVEEAVGAIPAPTGSVPVGSIMIWMNSSAPAGWFKLQGGSFDVNQYPQLHAYLQKTDGYSSGRLPSWGGHYPGEYGDHINQSLGSKQGYKTGMPSGGAPYHPNSIPNGNTRTFNATGGTNAYSDGKARPAITEGWDTVTRPKTVVVHYIIKHD